MREWKELLSRFSSTTLCSETQTEMTVSPLSCGGSSLPFHCDRQSYRSTSGMWAASDYLSIMSPGRKGGAKVVLFSKTNRDSGYASRIILYHSP